MPRKTSKDASNPILWIQKLFRCNDYFLSGYAYDKLSDGEFALRDIESCILEGSVRQIRRDKLDASKDGKEYVISGRSSNGLPFETVGKLIDTVDGEKFFLITAYRRT